MVYKIKHITCAVKCIALYLQCNNQTANNNK